jgi:putative tRNA adenosine deaminase-associated protein
MLHGNGHARGCWGWTVAQATLDDDALDFALVAWSESGRWQVSQVPPRAAMTLDGFISAARQQGGDTGAVGMVSIDEDFFIIVRTFAGAVRVLISDATAAEDWPLAREVLKRLDEPIPDADADDDIIPAGDMGLLADLGLPADQLEELCCAVDLYPDEMLATIAKRLGFSEQFDAILELLP